MFDKIVVLHPIRRKNVKLEPFFLDCSLEVVISNVFPVFECLRPVLKFTIRSQRFKYELKHYS